MFKIGDRIKNKFNGKVFEVIDLPTPPTIKISNGTILPVNKMGNWVQLETERAAGVPMGIASPRQVVDTPAPDAPVNYFVCDKDGKQFKTKRGYKQHMKAKHQFAGTGKKGKG